VKTEVKKLEKNKVSVRVEVPPAHVEQALNKAWLSLAGQVNIPGFRKGKIPRKVLEARIGKTALGDEALRLELPSFYAQAISSAKLEPIAAPKIDVVTPLEMGKTFVFNATIEVKPSVKLKGYKGIKVKKLKTTVTKKELEDELEILRDRFSQLKEIKGRSVKSGDFVLIDYEGKVEGKTFEGGTASDYLVEIGSKTLVEGFEEQLIGVKKGEEREVKVSFPKKYIRKNLAGKQAVFKVRIKEIKKKIQPELDDEFAKKVGVKSLEELRKDVKNRLKNTKKSQSDALVKRQLIKEATDKATVEVPQVMVDAYTERLYSDFVRELSMRGVSLEEYLEVMNTTAEKIRENLAKEAKQAAKTDLVFEAIARKEDISIADKELQQELNKIYERIGEESQKFKEGAEGQRREELLKNALREELLKRKTVDFLVEKAEIS
jgi:trigger factor